MPVYEFECQKCGHVTSFLESSSRSEDAHACEKCGSKKTAKLFSSFAPMSASPAPPEGGCAQCPSQFSCPNQH